MKKQGKRNQGEVLCFGIRMTPLLMRNPDIFGTSVTLVTSDK